jgi:hypothetical protein
LTLLPGGAAAVAKVKVAKVKAAARPWRSIFLLVLAVAMATLSRSARTAAASGYFPDTAYRALGHTGTEALADAAAVAFCVLAYLGTAGLAGRAREVLEPKIGTSHAAVIRYAIVLLGGLATILITCSCSASGSPSFWSAARSPRSWSASRRSRACPTCSRAWSCCWPGRSTSVTRY